MTYMTYKNDEKNILWVWAKTYQITYGTTEKLRFKKMKFKF